MAAAMPTVLCLAGPTAAGKSACSLAIARRWPIEIVNVDSATIYRDMDIGTAKPGAQERADVPQHLLDIRDPAQAYSAAEFRADALGLIRDIRARGRIPLLAGGTMLYFKALRDGLDDLPGADPVLRAELDARAAREGWPALHQQLRELDPATAARLAPNDSQRIQRALEICLLSGRPMSSLLQQRSPPRAGSVVAHPAAHQAAAGAQHPDDRNAMRDETAYRYVTISLEPSDRAVLHARIEQRFDAMLAAGLLDEVRALRARGDLHPGLPSIRCVGYRQLWACLEGDTDLAQARAQALAATRQLAKRQLTWLRSQPDRHIVDCLAADAPAQVIALCAQLMTAP
jgi:tRNA dimethylallyltransferase